MCRIRRRKAIRHVAISVYLSTCSKVSTVPTEYERGSERGDNLLEVRSKK